MFVGQDEAQLLMWFENSTAEYRLGCLFSPGLLRTGGPDAWMVWIRGQCTP